MKHREKYVESEGLDGIKEAMEYKEGGFGAYTVWVKRVG